MGTPQTMVLWGAPLMPLLDSPILFIALTLPKHSMTDLSQYRNLPQILLAAREALMKHFRPLIRAFDLTDQQWRVLRIVYEEQAIEPRILCEQCQIVSASMAGVLTRMEERDLIRRAPFPGDQRRALIKITPKGQDIAEQLSPLITEQYRRVEQALGKKQLQLFVDTVEDFVAAEQSVTIESVSLPPD
ncbi:MAG TPA: homoprotocatechuate degradation operon regulator HpaR [Paenalcaligenes sp.]|nr:homoprotocatechuate degradation operon regulator HpaR [Paenalcaligenes sp.]